MSTLYRRGKTWWVKYSIYGKPHFKSLRTQSKAIAKREQQALDAKLLEPYRHFRPSNDISIETLWPPRWICFAFLDPSIKYLDYE